jgi:hypothetical protein
MEMVSIQIIMVLPSLEKSSHVVEGFTTLYIIFAVEFIRRTINEQSVSKYLEVPS